MAICQTVADRPLINPATHIEFTAMLICWDRDARSRRREFLQADALVLKLRVCDYPNPTRQRGIAI